LFEDRLFGFRTHEWPHIAAILISEFGIRNSDCGFESWNTDRELLKALKSNEIRNPQSEFRNSPHPPLALVVPSGIPLALVVVPS
jgi:hypothetical protein